MFLVTTLKTGTSQVSETRPKANSIKPVLLEETPTPATNRSTTIHSRITKKYNIFAQVTLILSSDVYVDTLALHLRTASMTEW